MTDNKKSISGWVMVLAIISISSIIFVGFAYMVGLIQISDDGTGLTIIDNNDNNDLIDNSGMVSVNRPIKFILINEFTKSAGASFTCTLYGEDGITVKEPSGTSGADGNWTTNGNYPSGTKLILYCVSGENDIRHKVTVPKMSASDVDAVATNSISVSTFTVPTADIVVSALPSSTGTALADGGDWNKTVSGNTDTITFNWNLPTNDEGFISSYDEINKMNWNAVLYAKLYNTNYELVTLDGFDGQYTKGTATWYYKTLADWQLQKDALGSGYAYDEAGHQLNGASSFAFNIDATGYSGDSADIELYIYVKSDPAYHNLKGSFGPDSYAVITSSPFTIDLVD